MPVVPECLSSRQGSRSAIASQFWESAEHSSRYIDGQVWELPCEPPALNLIGSSGLSRAQQMIAAQSMGLPVIPSYDANSGGLVLDRVITKMGGRRWWTSLSGRVKAQRLYSSIANGQGSVQALKDLHSYALCARTRLQLGRRVTFNGVVEAPDAELLRARLAGECSAANPTEQAGEQAGGLAAHATLRATLPGHDLTASLGRNLDYVESSGDYARVPQTASLDLSSHDRGDGLQYRVGVLQVSAPPTETAVKPLGGRLPMRTVLHAQGAVAVEGEAYVWRGGSGSGNNNSINSTTTTAVTGPSGAASKEAAKAGTSREAPAPKEERAQEEAGAPHIVSALASAAAADIGEQLPGGDTALRSAMHDAAAAPEGASNSSSSGTAAGKGRGGAGKASDMQRESAHEPGQLPALEAFIRPLEKLGESLHPPSHTPPDQKGTALVPRGRDQLLPVTAETVSAAIADSLALLSQLRSTVARVTSDVQDGSLQRLNEQLTRRQPPRQRPYSVLLAQPHLKLNAAMGCLARMPLPSLRGLINGAASDPGISGSNGGSSVSGGLHRRSASAGSLASRASISSQVAEAWEPYLKGTALRVFASAGVSGQLGRFTRPFLDYTAASLRVDLGLTSPHVVGAVPGAAAASHAALDDTHRPDKHRAFALEGRGAWHALSVSLAQQIFGPVRARADFKFALDPTNIPQNQGERSTVKGLAQTALSVRPSLLEGVFGADVVLPGSEGAARLAVWWSPKRREAMAELRLF